MPTFHISTRDDAGQTMAEYAVVLGMIVIVTVATFSVLLSGAILSTLERTIDVIRSAV